MVGTATSMLCGLALVHATLANPVNSGRNVVYMQEEKHDFLKRSEASTARVQRVNIPGLAAMGMEAFRERPVATAEPCEHQMTNNILPLDAVSGSAPSSRYVDLMINPLARDAPADASIAKRDIQALKNGSAPIENILNSVFLTQVKFGGEEFEAVLDTGSSDTWLVGDDFECVDAEKTPVAAETCKFGPTYRRTNTFKQLPDMHFNISYVDGEQLTGILGRETVSLGGIMVDNQTVAVVDRANWHGDGKSSGLIGLAWPSITQAVQGPAGGVVKEQGPVTAVSPPATKPAKIAYDPVFFTMQKQGLIAPYFSMAINRVEEGPGVLALGGLPGGAIKYESNFTTVPMEYLTFKGQLTPKSYSLYMVKAGGLKVDATEYIAKSSFNVVVDSGTTLAYLPSDVASAINSAWTPPALFDITSRQYYVECDAKAPKVSITIGGMDLRIDAADLKLPGSGGNLCVSGIQQATGMSLLGGPFLKNVLAVFDVGAAQMRFANRIRP